MPAIYVCDLCGKHQPMEEQLTVVAREPDPEEWHFCEECSRVHIQPILDKAAEAKVGRGLTHPLKLKSLYAKVSARRGRDRERCARAHPRVDGRAKPGQDEGSRPIFFLIPPQNFLPTALRIFGECVPKT